MIRTWFKGKSKTSIPQVVALDSANDAARKNKVAAALLTGLAVAAPAAALPTGGTVANTSGGTTTFTNVSPTELVINQDARRVVIDWAGGFNINTGERVTFRQGDNRFIAVNRVNNGSGTFINGILEGLVPNPADPAGTVFGGNVWILNQNGLTFGPTARVDVHGLLATTASLTNPAAFVAAADGDPIGFTGVAGGGGPIFTSSGSQIRAHGGPAMLITGGGNATNGRLQILGSVTGEGDAAQQASSQILFGAAGNFTLRFNAAPPNALSSGDLDLLDFVIDSGFAPTATSPSSFFTAINLGASSTSRAGQVIVAARGQTGDTSGNSIFSDASLSATGVRGAGQDLLINSAGGVRNGVADGDLAGSVGGVQFQRSNSPGAPSGGPSTLGPLVTLQSAGGMIIRGNRVILSEAIGVSTGGTQWTAPQNIGVVLQGQSRPVIAAGTGGVIISSTDAGGATITSQGDLTVRAGIALFNIFSLNAAGLLSITEPTNNVLSPTPIDFVVGQPITAGSISATTRGLIQTGAITATAGNLTLSGNQGITTGALSAGAWIDLRTLTTGQAGISTGALSAGTSALLLAGGPVNVNGPVTAGTFIDLRSNNSSLNVSGALNAAQGSLIGRAATTLAFGGAASSDTFLELQTTTGAINTAALTSRTQSVQARGQGGVQTGAVDAGTFTELTSANGAVAVGSTQAPAAVRARVGFATLSGATGVSAGDVTATSGVSINGQRGAVNVGAVSGPTISVQTSTATTAPGGAIRTGALNATVGGVFVSSPSDVAITGGVNAAGLNITAGGASTPADVTITGPTTLSGAPSALTSSINASRDITLNGPITVSRQVAPNGPLTQFFARAGRDLILNGAFTSQNGAQFIAGNIFRNTAPIRVLSYFGSPPTSGGWVDAVTIQAADVDIGDLISASGFNGSSVGISFAANHTDGIAVGDGVTRRFTVNNAEFARLNVRNLTFESSVANIAPGPGSGPVIPLAGPLVVGDLTIDAARTSSVFFGVGPTGTLRFQGTVRGIGAPEVWSGFFNAGVSFVPGRLEVVGRVGTVDNPVGNLQLRSRGDILIGSQAFIDAFDQAADKLAFDPTRYRSSFGGMTPGHLFAVATTGNIAAPGFVMQQNTGIAAPGGVRLGIPAPTDFGLIYASSGVSPTGAPTVPAPRPLRVELFGSVVDRNGLVRSGADAPGTVGMLSSNLTSTAAYRINGCQIGGAGPCTGVVGEAPVNQAILAPPVDTIIAAEPVRDEEQSKPLVLPDTGSGMGRDGRVEQHRQSGLGTANEDLWPSRGK